MSDSKTGISKTSVSIAGDSTKTRSSAAEGTVQFPVRCKVGQQSILLDRTPAGDEGEFTCMGPSGLPMRVRFRRDPNGVWLEFPHATLGYDLEGERDEHGRMQYRVTQRQADGLWNQVSVFKAGEETTSAAGGNKKKAARVRAQMPGRILRVLAKVGDRVEKGQPLLVMEAMKMENEIKASLAGIVQEIKVQEQSNVETGADLLLIQTGDGL